MDMGLQSEVRPAAKHRPQESFRRIPTPALALIDLEVADPFVVAAVEVVACRQSGLLRRLRKRVQNFPTQALFFDTPLAAGTMESGEFRVMRLARMCWPGAH